MGQDMYRVGAGDGGRDTTSREGGVSSGADIIRNTKVAETHDCVVVIVQLLTVFWKTFFKS